MNTTSVLKNSNRQAGQVIIEAVLLAVIFVALWMSITNYVKNTNMVKKLIEDGLWTKISGMIENGVWENPQKGRKLHPNNLDRSVSKQE